MYIFYILDIILDIKESKNFNLCEAMFSFTFYQIFQKLNQIFQSQVKLYLFFIVMRNFLLGNLCTLVIFLYF